MLSIRLFPPTPTSILESFTEPVLSTEGVLYVLKIVFMYKTTVIYKLQLTHYLEHWFVKVPSYMYIKEYTVELQWLEHLRTMKISLRQG